MYTRKFISQGGATLVEVLVAIALAGILLPAFAEAILTSHASRPAAERRLAADALEREAMEAVRVVRETGWSGVSTNGTYHPVQSGNTWILASGTDTTNGLTRQIVIADTQRNSSDVIVASGGTNDPSTKHVTVTISWTTPYPSSLSEETYLSRWRNNTSWLQTTQADFNGGTLTNTAITNTSGGEVQLQDTPATWQLPSLIGGYNITGNVSGLCVYEATIGTTPYAFVGYATGMAIVNVSNPAAPTLAGIFTTSAAVNGIFVSGTTAYLATAISNSQLMIVNVSNPAAPTQTSILKVGGNAAGNAIFVSGTFAYLVKNAETGSNSEFDIINVSNLAAPTLSGTIGKQNANYFSVYVSGNFAYVATAQTNAQFRIINVTSKTAPTVSSSVNLGIQANSVTLDSTTAYIGTLNNTTTGELRIYNVATPTTPTSLGNYEVGGNVNGVDLDSANPSYVILATAVTSKQAIIVNVATPSSPTLVNNVNLGSTTNEVIVNGGYAYFGSTNTAQELVIVYTGYRPSGTFESSTFNAGGIAGFNSLLFTNTVPAGSTLQFQVAANNTGTGWSYVGPDGTSGTYFTTSPSGLPMVVAGGQYFRYKAYFTPTANGQQTPVLSDVTLNYSL